jgi:MinD superfamily P-loop ATPase
MTEEIEKYCQENKIPLAGKIVYDPIVTEAVVNKKPVVEYSDGEVVRQIKDIWKTTYNELKSL